ncbi:lipid A biosynthesis acyltransferase [Sulfurimonas gotlandica GD1]|uniref:Lipid A biosynthesis acyltransferase n=1 Tax=Sulfurimonas gotlandica (strain DSM 19862 / JCM 16533 / GD1) TaxID=929558 RepID=B6BHB8_SULGG|nr:lysophospholipid acyltransferase family protein [Sulfurimonas gotlandica]EDZ63448.1 lipid IVA acyltransferase family protein [Sulfurimonas gotlandica GD1]EHP29912.1 lipid A biosynthesis acyltransferase [Sulfurimonas gotlandica GD1]
MEIKQRGNAYGYKLLLFAYNIFGYNLVAFILNFVALYYLFFAPSVKKSMKSYYDNQGIKLTNKSYFNHLKMFAISIFDRFVSRIKPEDLTFCVHNSDVIKLLNENGGIILLSHVGSWASAAHCLNDELPPMSIVMRENTKENIQQVEKNNERENEQRVKIIDLNQGAISANIQIANALMNKELVAMMADRAVDKTKTVKVEFLNKNVLINKNPFEIALRVKKPLVAIFVTNYSLNKYDINLELIEDGSIEQMSQDYTNILQKTIKKHPNQWYNFYDFFKKTNV